MTYSHCSHCDTIENQDLIKQTIVAGTIGIPLFIATMLNLIPTPNTTNGYLANWACAIVTFIVLMYSGGHFFRGAWQALLSKSSNMNTLIAIGTGASWTYSVLILLFINYLPPIAQHVYFESVVIIITLVNLGAIIEQRAQRNTKNAIESLIKLQPATARLIRGTDEIDVAITTLKIGDLIKVRPGEKIPIDGMIIAGNSSINESMLSGEAMPCIKNIGDQITGGTVNNEGSFIFKATRVGKNTVLSQIIELVQQAQNSKPKLARLADKISAVFVPMVIIISIVTALVWYFIDKQPVIVYMLMTSISVLIIACPCALGLAVPMSVMIGIGNAAKQGILIRDANTLQNACKINTVVLDKTGTITIGKPSLTGIITVPGFKEDEVLSIAASLEVNSEHPYAVAIITAANAKQIKIEPVNNFENFPGLGIKANRLETPVCIGNKGFMEAQLVNLDYLREQAKNIAKTGATAIYVAKNKQLIGLLTLADPIKPEAKFIVQKLHDMQINVIMITGDQQSTAEAVAAQVGITEIVADVMPQEKANHIVKLQQDGLIIAMAGDGVNDAPALRQADIGFAMGTGTDIAIHTSDVTLIDGSLDKIIDTIYISKLTVTNMKQNLLGAFIYNIIGIPIAAGVLFPLTGMLLNPMLAAAAMALSSITVVINANRLRSKH